MISKIDFKYVVTGIAVLIGFSLLLNNNYMPSASGCSSDFARPCYERQNSATIQARAGADIKQKLNKETGEKEFSSCVKNYSNRRGETKERTAVCNAEVVQYCEGNWDDNKNNDESDSAKQRIKKYDGRCGDTPPPEPSVVPPLPKNGKGLRVLTPNNGERFIRGQGNVHISWTGGTEKVWVMLKRMDLQQWHWLSTATPPYPLNDYITQGSVTWEDIIAIDQPPSGALEWDGMTACFGYPQIGCRQIPPGIYAIEIISQVKKNQPLTWDITRTASGYTYDDSDLPFMMVTPSSISSLKVDKPVTGDHWKSNWIIDYANRILWTTVGNGQSGQYAQIYTMNLYKGGVYIGTMYNAYYDGTFGGEWMPQITSSLIAGDDYTVEVIFHGQNGDVKAMSQPFSFDAS